MIYLLTQMILCLALAALAGGAAGWLLHRARTGAEDEALRETIVRQHHQLRRAETDVAMLTDDFDDLKQRSQGEIESLRHENRRLPTLVQNLDKSQTLVRQLMQQHEDQLREINQQNQTLRARLVGHEDREAAFARARAELESARTELAALRASRPGAPAESTEESPVHGTDAPAVDAADGASSAGSPGHADPPPDEGVGASAVAGGPARGASTAPAAARESADDAPRQAWTPRASASRAGTTRLAPDPPDFERTGFGLDLDALLDEERADGKAEAGGDARDADIAAVDLPGGPVRGGSVELARTSDDDRSVDDGADLDDDELVHDPMDDGDEDDPDDEAFDDGDFDDIELDDELDDADLDGEGFLDDSVELMFEPVDRHDDLQRILGIGPVTERALNRLGITSYSQLAELDRREVEQIADALQIYPGRIERDDWVGNARRQLEDVLEEL